MLAAGEEIEECNRVLHRVQGNVVHELISLVETFYEWDHHPDGDVYDDESHAQYYFHSHRPEGGEHGHFHTFIRRDGIPAKIQPVPNESGEAWPEGDDNICHLIAIAMDNKGFPIRLFTTNRWVTGENWYKADDVIALLERFEIDHAWPSWPANRWVGAMLRFYRPQIELLIRERDRKIEAWSEKHPERDIFEDEDLEVTSVMQISLDKQMAAVKQALAKK